MRSADAREVVTSSLGASLKIRSALTALIAATVMAGVVVPAAHADVLIDPPAKRMTTSGCIGLGVWYQSYSGGPRTITASVYYHGRRRARRRLTATTRWRDHVLYCPGYPNAGRWVTRVSGNGWHARFVTRVTIDMD